MCPHYLFLKNEHGLITGTSPRGIPDLAQGESRSFLRAVQRLELTLAWSCPSLGAGWESKVRVSVGVPVWDLDWFGKGTYSGSLHDSVRRAVFIVSGSMRGCVA